MSKNRVENPFDDPSAYHGQVRMAAVQVVGLNHGALEMALAYEVETASGITAAEAEVAYRQIPNADTTVNVYEVAVRRRGSKAALGSDKFLKPLVIAGVAAVVLASADFGWLAYRSAELEKAVAARMPLQAKIDAVQARVKRVRSEISRLRQEREAEAKAQDDAAKLREANLNALKCVASACGDKAVLKAMTGDPFAISAKVMATSAQSAADMMARLAELSAAKGWKLEVGSTSLAPQGATAECEFCLRYD